MKKRKILLEEADSIARTLFKESLKGRNIDDVTYSKLSIGACVPKPSDYFYVFEILLHNRPVETNNIEFESEDSKLMVTIKVNKVSGEAELIEHPEIKW